MSQVIGVCELGRMEDGLYTLNFDVNESEEISAMLEEKGYYGTGYTWEAMIVAVLEMKGIDTEGLDFDPESDMFAAYSENKQALITVSNIINELIKDDALMSKALANTDEAEKLDD